MSGPARHRIGLEVEVTAGEPPVEPGDWDLDELTAALREGTARPVRVIRGRVTDEQHDPLSTTLEGWAEDVDLAPRLHWMVSDSRDPVIRPVVSSPRPSLETLVELQSLAEHMRRVAARLRVERL